jgi:hypothetical protein
MSLNKTDVTGYIADSESGAILNDDENEYKRFLAERARAKEFNQLKKTVETLLIRLSQLEARVNGNTDV